MIEPANTLAAILFFVNPAVAPATTSTVVKIVRATNPVYVLGSVLGRSAGGSTSKPAGVPISARSTTEIEPLPQAALSTTAIDQASNRISSFKSPGVEDALAFLNTLPSYFPLPKSVCSEDDVVSLFWNTETFYADVDFPGGGVMSIFTRQRGERSLDSGLDDVPVDTPFHTWGPRFLQPLLPAMSAAA